MSTIKNLYRDKHIRNVAAFIPENIQYECRMGSIAHGVSNDTSDTDLYAWTIPPRHFVFPHTNGHIPNFGKAPDSFDVYQQHHIETTDTEYDINVYGIVKYFSLCMDNNPNMIDSLFVRDQSITFTTKIGQMVRDNRKLFLHTGSWHRFRGYAYQQLKRTRSTIGNPNTRTGKRAESIEKYGFDVKDAYHVVRLMNEIEQILVYGDIDLMQNNDQLKDIRAGNWTFDQIESWFVAKENSLESVYNASTLQKYPDEEKIKQLLLDCLEEFYGSITVDDVATVSKYEQAMADIKAIVSKF